MWVVGIAGPLAHASQCGVELFGGRQVLSRTVDGGEQVAQACVSERDGSKASPHWQTEGRWR